MARTNLSAEKLRDLLHYNPETGVFTWANPQPTSKFKPGQVAGSYFFDHTGHQRHRVKINGHHWYSGRLAWLYMTGEHPKFHIDHINGNALDNRFCNLRDAPPIINAQNLHRPRRNSAAQLLGITRNGKHWVARIKSNGKRICLGTFDSPEHAHAAYIAAKRELHPGCTI